jgi:hypothetical protein
MQVEQFDNQSSEAQSPQEADEEKEEGSTVRPIVLRHTYFGDFLALLCFILLLLLLF